MEFHKTIFSKNLLRTHTSSLHFSHITFLCKKCMCWHSFLTFKLFLFLLQLVFHFFFPLLLEGHWKKTSMLCKQSKHNKHSAYFQLFKNVCYAKIQRSCYSSFPFFQMCVFCPFNIMSVFALLNKTKVCSCLSHLFQIFLLSLGQLFFVFMLLNKKK